MTKDAIHIREAVSDDAEELIALNENYNGLDLIDTDISNVRRSLADNSSEFVIVATSDSHLIGFECVHIFRSFCYERSNFELA